LDKFKFFIYPIFSISSSLSPIRATTIAVAIVGRAITKGGAIEKSPILLSQYLINEEFDSELRIIVYSQLYKNRFCGLVVIPEVIEDIRSKRGTFDWLMAN
jgi:hypothetical protein